MKLIVIPFAGFYETVHSGAIDDAEQQMFSDRDTGCERNEGLEMALYWKCNHQQVFKAYAERYCSNFSDAHELGLEFDGLSSPREYNFTTDRIFAKIPEASVTFMWEQVDKARLDALIKRRFTSCDGFFSFYDNALEDWPEDVLDWDHNQLGTLLECWMGDWDQYDELDLMDGDRGNGFFDTIIADATPGIERLFKIHDYLEQRAAR